MPNGTEGVDEGAGRGEGGGGCDDSKKCIQGVQKWKIVYENWKQNSSEFEIITIDFIRFSKMYTGFWLIRVYVAIVCAIVCIQCAAKC